MCTIIVRKLLNGAIYGTEWMDKAGSIKLNMDVTVCVYGWEKELGFYMRSIGALNGNKFAIKSFKIFKLIHVYKKILMMT